jgi:hypothetical protein
MCRTISLIATVLLVVTAVMATTLAFAGTAFAQTAPTTTPTTSATYTDTVQGTEFSAGTIEGDTRFGASFAGEATGNLPGFLVATTDYTPPSPGPNITNNLVGGGWALLGERGTVFGTFSGGTVQWNADGTLADIVADMSVLGGSVDGVPVSSGGVGTFGGVLDHRPLAQGLPPTVDGTLQLTF